MGKWLRWPGFIKWYALVAFLVCLFVSISYGQQNVGASLEGLLIRPQIDVSVTDMGEVGLTEMTRQNQAHAALAATIVWRPMSTVKGSIFLLPNQKYSGIMQLDTPLFVNGVNFGPEPTKAGQTGSSQVKLVKATYSFAQTQTIFEWSAWDSPTVSLRPLIGFSNNQFRVELTGKGKSDKEAIESFDVTKRFMLTGFAADIRALNSPVLVSTEIVYPLRSNGLTLVASVGYFHQPMTVHIGYRSDRVVMDTDIGTVRVGYSGPFIEARYEF